ncbi:hypothetical protein GF373_17730 [bacterium]|nr:hypothetical protein [bacterium]
MSYYSTGSITPEQEYPAGGVEGLGYMQLVAESSAAVADHEAAVMYALGAEDEDIFLNLDLYTGYDAGAVFNWADVDLWQYRIYWEHSDDGDYSEWGYVYLDPNADECGWYWAGESHSYPLAISMDTWYTIDLHVKIDPAGDEEIKMYVDGVEQFDISQGITISDYTTLNRVWLGGRQEFSAGTENWIIQPAFDNFKVNNSVGSSPDNTYPWHLILIGLPVTGAGARTEMTPQPGGPNWDNVDEAPPDDADYNEAESVGVGDTYVVTDTPATVLGSANWAPTRLLVKNRQRVATPEGAGLKAIVRIGGVDYYATLIPAGTTFACEESVWLNNPATGGDWTTAVIDALEAGAETAAS